MNFHHLTKSWRKILRVNSTDLIKCLEMVRKDKRPNWDEYFMAMAVIASSRSTCYRTRCGAVIVQDKSIVSTGYNGAPKHQRNCLEIGSCPRNTHKIPSGTKLEFCRAVGSHAETNAIALAAKNGHSTDGAIMYAFGHDFICDQCKAQIQNAGITKVLHMDRSGVTTIYYPEVNWKLHAVDRVQDP